jgi:HK97 family phage prohead protease
MTTASEDGLRFAGYAALFDKRDAGRDTIRPGAFARTLAERDARRQGPLPLFWQHNPDQQIGWIENAAEDERGLRVIARIDNPAGGAAGSESGQGHGLSRLATAPAPSTTMRRGANCATSTCSRSAL